MTRKGHDSGSRVRQLFPRLCKVRSTEHNAGRSLECPDAVIWAQRHSSGPWQGHRQVCHKTFQAHAPGGSCLQWLDIPQSYISHDHSDIFQSYIFQSSQSHISIIHISIINISWSYISQSYISSLDLDLDLLPRLTRPYLQMSCTCITRHIMQSHNGLEHIFVPCWRGGNWGFHCLKTLKFQNFSGRCPEPRWGAHSAPHTPSWFCLVPPGHLNPGSATEDDRFSLSFFALGQSPCTIDIVLWELWVWVWCAACLESIAACQQRLLPDPARTGTARGRKSRIHTLRQDAGSSG